MIKAVVGLGNPGFRYRATRHNIGFMVLDRIASDSRIKIKKRTAHSLYGRGRLMGQEILLVKPLTYMNLSGKAVSEIKESNDIPLEDLLIVMDDIDLPFGRIRLRPKGSSGTHKGLHSIIEELGTENFLRLRVGIGSQNNQGKASILSDYVLAPFKREEKKALDDLIERCSRCIRVWIKEGPEAAMNRFNP